MKALKERIAKKVSLDSSTSCWLWTGCCSSNGYGRIIIDYKTVGAHRAAYLAYVGHIPRGLFVLHRCDVKSCVNPEHLFLGTHQDNMTDMANKHRSRSKDGHHNWKGGITLNMLEYKKDWYKKNVDKALISQHKYNDANRDAINARQREYNLKKRLLSI